MEALDARRHDWRAVPQTWESSLTWWRLGGGGGALLPLLPLLLLPPPPPLLLLHTLRLR